MDGVKNIFASKGIWGSVISLIGMFAPVLGYDLGPDVITDATSLAERVASAVNEIMAIGGAALALWGRISATKKLALKS